MHDKAVEKTTRRTGIFLASIFFLGLVFRIFEEVAKVEHRWGLAAILAEPGNWILLLATVGLCLSAFWAPAVWFQPIVFLLLAPIPLIQLAESLYGLGFYVMGILLLFRLGFFERHRLPKLICSIVYLYLWEVVSALRTGRDLIGAFEPVFFVTVFLLMLYFAFSEKLMVYLKEPKAKLSLREKTLSEAERAYVMALLKDGKNYKEIAFDFEVSESTVRNTLARAYKKLGVSDHAGLASLGNKYEIVD
jgi:DNA-binding CsgD family transcriptional regulator